MLTKCFINDRDKMRSRIQRVETEIDELIERCKEIEQFNHLVGHKTVLPKL